MRAAVYARVSSATQRDRHTIDSQLRVLPEYVRRQGWRLVGQYVDDGRSARAGKLAARAGLAGVLRDAAAGAFDVLVVVDVDRLTRSEDLAERGAILGGLQRAGVKVAITTTGQLLDFSDSTGDLYGSLQAFFAAEWGRKHRSRIVEGKLTAISRGKKPAGPTPYGYRYDRATGVWSIDEAEAEVIREAFRRAAAGETAKAIADNYFARRIAAPRGRRGGWERWNVYHLFRQTAYRGEWVADRRRKLTVAVPPIVTEAEWHAVRDRAAARGRQLGALRRTRHTYLVEGMAVCRLCGARIAIASAVSQRGGKRMASRYVCPNRRNPPRGVERCRGRYWWTAEVDERVWAALLRLINRPDLVEQVARRARAEAGADTEAWRRDLEAAERKLDRLAKAEAGILARYQAGSISEAGFDGAVASIAREREQAGQQAAAARGAQFSAGRRSRAADALESVVAELRASAEATTPEERRELVALLVPVGGVKLSVAEIDVDVLLAAAPARSTGGIALVRSAD